MRVTPYQDKIIKAILAFANLKRISKKEILKIVASGDPFNVRPVWENLRSMSPEGILNHQEKLCQKLSVIVRGWKGRGGNKAVAAIGEEVAEILNNAAPITKYEFKGNQMWTKEAVTRMDLETWIASGLVPILPGPLGLTSRLGECRQCGRFRLDLSGKPRSFCNATHKKLWDYDDAKYRVERWRKRQKLKRR